MKLRSDRATGWYMVWYEPEHLEIGFAALWNREKQTWKSFRFGEGLTDKDFIMIGARVK